MKLPILAVHVSCVLHALRPTPRAVRIVALRSAWADRTKANIRIEVALTAPSGQHLRWRELRRKMCLPGESKKFHGSPGAIEHDDR